VQFGLKLDMEKVSVDMAHKSKIKEPAQYFSKQEEMSAIPGMEGGMPGAAGGMPGGMPSGQPAPQGMEKAGEIRKPPIRQVI
jgi:hypothetical protein